MKIFLDTANIDEIKKYSQMGIIDGVTTNPALMAKEGRKVEDVINDILDYVDGPISAEVISTDVEGMIREATILADIHENIVVKIPAIPAGYQATKYLSERGINVNFTMVYTANQALLAAKVGAAYVSPFIGRLDINSTNGIDLIKEIVQIYENYNFITEILAASMRTAVYVKEVALAGADVATIPPVALADMVNNELTNVSLDGFLAEYNKLPEDKKYVFS